jgi:hypothetical protein
MPQSSCRLTIAQILADATFTFRQSSMSAPTEVLEMPRESTFYLQAPATEAKILMSVA